MTTDQTIDALYQLQPIHPLNCVSPILFEYAVREIYVGEQTALKQMQQKYTLQTKKFEENGGVRGVNSTGATESPTFFSLESRL